MSKNDWAALAVGTVLFLCVLWDIIRSPEVSH